MELNAWEATWYHDRNTEPGQEPRDLGVNLFVLHLVLSPFTSSKLYIFICTESPFAFPIEPMEPKYRMKSLQGLWEGSHRKVT